MFLKFRYSVGYEQLCVQVTDSLSWRRFCRIGLEARVPDESTIRKITRRCGPELIEALNDALLVKAHAAGKVDLDMVRVDTTVVDADIKYSTDSGLLTKAICRIAKLLRRLERSGVSLVFVDRTNGVGGQLQETATPGRRLLDKLAVLVERTRKVITQAQTRVAGSQPDGATRLVSLHEPDARPIRKDSIGRPVEFGYKG